MKLAQIGEFGLIDEIKKLIGGTAGLIIGPGDDAAAWRSEGAVSLATTDALVENVHFKFESMDWHSLGWKALAVSLSDIAAMGGQATVALMCLALPGQTQVEDIKEFYRGALDLAGEFKVAIAGGNVSNSPCVSITTTVFGTAISAGRLLVRSGAMVGEDIAVTGFPGRAAAGLELLSNKTEVSKPASRELTRAFRKPFPRLKEAGILVENGIRSAIDLSDGLIADLEHVLAASHVGASVDTDKIALHILEPIFTRKEALKLALSGGEDYELLFTGSPDSIERVRKQLEIPVTVIGQIVEDHPGKVSLCGSSASLIDAGFKGWSHYRH